jgi:hypothetical protein
MDWGLKLGDLAIVAATLLGPVLAVQVQKLVERGREQGQRRVTIFRVLMATRGALLSPAHVEAINIIPIEFYGKRGRKLRIIEKWKEYIDHLYKDPSEQTWGSIRIRLLNELLAMIGDYIGYKFNSVEISRELYSPRGHATIENDQEIIRTGLAKVFRGEMGFPMDVKAFPVDANFAKNQLDIQQGLIGWLDGQRSVRMTMESKP